MKSDKAGKTANYPLANDSSVLSSPGTRLQQITFFHQLLQLQIPPLNQGGRITHSTSVNLTPPWRNPWRAGCLYLSKWRMLLAPNDDSFMETKSSTLTDRFTDSPSLQLGVRRPPGLLPSLLEPTDSGTAGSRGLDSGWPEKLQWLMENRQPQIRARKNLQKHNKEARHSGKHLRWLLRHHYKEDNWIKEVRREL